MKIYTLFLIALLSFACNANRQTATNSNPKTTYTPPEKLAQPPEYLAEQAKHEKFEKDREEYLKKVNELEKQRLEAIRKCEAAKFKKSRVTNTNTNAEAPESKLTCEEQHPPIFEKDLAK